MKGARQGEREKVKDLAFSSHPPNILASVDQLYAFTYKMNSNTTARESKIEKSWFVFDPEREFARQGITDKWRVSTLNQDYQVHVRWRENYSSK